MSDIKIIFKEKEFNFDIEQYNQIYINNYYSFFQFMIILKKFEGEKLDEYSSQKYSGELFLYNQKQNKKNLLVIDLNDFSKIINNLTFEKNSLLKKIYFEILQETIGENLLEEYNQKTEELFKVNDILEFDYKYPSVEKIVDFFFNIHFEEKRNFLKKPNNIIQIIQKYLDYNMGMKSILIIDSSIKAFEYEKLITDERIIIIDSCLDINKNSKNLLIFQEDGIENIDLVDLINSIQYKWPEEIRVEEIKTLLKLYLKIILNDEIDNFDKPSENFLVLYIIIRKLLNLELHKLEKLTYYIEKMKKSKKVAYILDNLI